MIERNDPVNWSTLKYMRHSPRMYRYMLANPRPDTDALKLGRALHTAVYEEDQFRLRYAVMPKFHAGQNDDTAIRNGYEGGKQAKAIWEADHAGVEILPADMYSRVVGMRNALMEDTVACRMIVGGFAEQPVTWDDHSTGIACRGRVDHVNGCLSDLKSARDAGPVWFPRDAVKYGYHAQLAFYADGLEANGVILMEQPALIVVESAAPYDVVVYRFTEDQLAVGRAVYRRCLDRLAECRRDNHWPGVANNAALQMALPPWADSEAAGPEAEFTMGGEVVTW